ncbi:MAG: hypothetical protein ACI4YA_00480 [Candidatus Spyradenecus sp.]
MAKVALGVGVVWAIYLLRASRWGQLSRLYPVVVSGEMLGAFAWSLRQGATPLVERFARKFEKQPLNARGVAYCRRVTWAWVLFLSAHVGVTVATLWASAEVWALYNGAIAYGLMGLMFAGEWLIRRRVRRG